MSYQMKAVGIAIVAALLASATFALASKHEKGRTVAIALTEKGFEPGTVKVKKGEPVTLVITRKTDATCAKEVVVPNYGIRKGLPLNRPVSFTLVPRVTGEIKYGCSMNMITGVLSVE